MLPIVQRELRAGARDPKLYKGRLRIGLVVILGAGLLLLAASPGAVGGAPGNFFWVMCWLALLFCLLEGVRKTADAISEERRDGTLGFLFLTDLRGFDVVLGKMAGAFIRSLSGLLAFVPILAITLLLGGITQGEFWRAVLVLILSLHTSLAICLAVSSMRKERSTGVCMAVLVALCVVPLIGAEMLRAAGLPQYMAVLQTASPAGMLLFASAAATFFTAWQFWTGAAIQGALAFLALMFASVVTPRVWQEKPGRAKALAPETPEGAGLRRAERSELLDQNPILWLAYSPRQHRRLTSFFMTIAGIFTLVSVIAYLDGGSNQAAAFVGFGIFVLALIVVVHLSSQASSNLAEAKRNGTLELLLSTPLKVRDIVSGQWLALRKMFLPALAVLLGFVFAMFFMTMRSMQLSNGIWLLKTVVELVLEFFVLGWVGMWSGLVSKSPNAAFFRTFLLGFLLPFLVCTPTILNQIVLLAVAMDKVNVQFRRFVAERYLQDPKFVLPPALPSAGGPPVIR